LAIGTVVLLFFMVFLSLLKNITIFQSSPPTASVSPKAQPSPEKPAATEKKTDHTNLASSGPPKTVESSKEAATQPVPQSPTENTPLSKASSGQPIPAVDSQKKGPEEVEKPPPPPQPKTEQSLTATEGLPYTIYAGVFKTQGDAQTTLRELATINCQAFILPLQVSGSIAQSLYGISQDGYWYRVFIGSFPNKEIAREEIGEIFEKLPSYQLEIMKFPYALECGRFLETGPAEHMMHGLEKDGFFPYSQTYQDKEGATIHRVLAGVFFSEHGALATKKDLERKGYNCAVSRR
jgi:cell division protein FtsN